ncbi:MAG: hypothetical protein IK133_03490 [Clostridia bacterium]|nr:hypothetical protein [Clostridia bacterium]
MKKILAFVLVLLMLAACALAEDVKPVMTHAEYIAADLETEVTVETYVQDKQGWWNDQAIIYCQSEDGAYFLYNMPISKEDYDLLVPGTKIRVNGYKSAWAGEVEIVDATFEILEGEAYIAEPVDVTYALGTTYLVAHQNELVALKGMTVKDYGDGNPFAYKDPVGKTDDIYIKFEKDGAEYEFLVEYYLRGNETEVYKAVEALQIGDVVDIEGFLYWYNGANLHITGVAK